MTGGAKVTSATYAERWRPLVSIQTSPGRLTIIGEMMRSVINGGVRRPAGLINDIAATG